MVFNQTNAFSVMTSNPVLANMQPQHHTGISPNITFNTQAAFGSGKQISNNIN
jgi:hypothetical protein